MTRMAFSGGLDTTRIVCFSGGSRPTSRPSVSSPRCSLYLGSSLVSCRSASLVSINVTQRLSTEDFRRISSSLPPQVLLPPLVSGDRTSAVCESILVDMDKLTSIHNHHLHPGKVPF
ncbi:unnamed protein product, partial [Brassica oleracea var. botrytis]